jgi:hypothetical protein
MDGPPAYVVGAIEIPAALLRVIDALCHALLWNFTGRASGARCFMAWDLVCHLKSEGGLGVRFLAKENSYIQVTGCTPPMNRLGLAGRGT